MKRILMIAAVLLLFMTGAAYADCPEENTLKQIELGTGRDEIHLRLGLPAEVSDNGDREIYCLNNGDKAVLLYDRAWLKNGYILME